VTSNPATQPIALVIGHMAHASAMASRGEQQNAYREMDVMREVAKSRLGINEGGARLVVAELAVVAGRVPPLQLASLRKEDRDLAQALHAAWSGDSVVARRALAMAQKTAEPKAVEIISPQVTGWLAYRQGRWHEVIDVLAPHARVGFYNIGSEDEILRLGSRWVVADAFSQLGQPDSAVTYLDLMLEPPGHPTHVVVLRGFYEPFVRNRLVRIYANAGRIDDARRQWDILSSTVTHPDPELVTMLEETRATLQAATAMRAPRP
jgi:hypothetical protein